MSWFSSGSGLNILNGRCARSISGLFGNQNLVGRQSASLGIRMGGLANSIIIFRCLVDLKIELMAGN